MQALAFKVSFEVIKLPLVKEDQNMTRPTTSIPIPATKALGQIASFAVIIAAMTVSARIQVPSFPVPMTLQTLVVLLSGLVAGPRVAAAGVASYLAFGFAGAPVFASGGGIAYLTSPTAGFLLSFVAATWVTGVLSTRVQGWVGMTLAVLLGTAVIYAIGIGWLAATIGFGTALKVGMLPFLLGDAVKAALAVMIASLFRGLRRSG